MQKWHSFWGDICHQFSQGNAGHFLLGLREESESWSHGRVDQLCHVTSASLCFSPLSQTERCCSSLLRLSFCYLQSRLFWVRWSLLLQPLPLASEWGRSWSPSCRSLPRGTALSDWQSGRLPALVCRGAMEKWEAFTTNPLSTIKHALSITFFCWVPKMLCCMDILSPATVWAKLESTLAIPVFSSLFQLMSGGPQVLYDLLGSVYHYIEKSRD